MTELAMPGNWRLDARCASLPIEESDRIFFPETTAYAEAREFCSGCVVQSECKTFARDNRVEFGVFGGETPKARGIRQPSARDLPAEVGAEIRRLYAEGMSVKKLMRQFRVGYMTACRAIDSAA